MGKARAEQIIPDANQLDMQMVVFGRFDVDKILAMSFREGAWPACRVRGAAVHTVQTGLLLLEIGPTFEGMRQLVHATALTCS